MKELIIEVTNKIFRDYATKEIIDQAERGEWAQDLWDILIDSELTSVGIPEELMGAGGDLEDTFSILNIVGKYAVPLPLAETILAKRLLAKYGEKTDSEPMTLNFSDGNEVQITKAGDRYIVNGIITDVPWGRFAKNIVAIGKVHGKTVIGKLPLTDVEIQNANNLAGDPSDTLIFTDTVFEQLSLYEVDEELVKKNIKNLMTLSKIAMMVGAMEKVLDLSVRYVKEREQFGRPLYRLQAIQQMIANLSGETVLSITAVNNAIVTFEENEFVQELAYARICVNEAAGIVTKIAHQIHGAIGVTYEHSLHQYTRRLWTWREEYGNESVWKDEIVNRMLESHDGSLWEMITGANALSLTK